MRRSRHEVRRHWPDELNTRNVSDELRQGVSVNEVAERHGSKANHLSSRRKLALWGKMILPELEDVAEFAAVVVDMLAPELPTAKRISGVKIVAGTVAIRLE